jgi:hypothetical protein
MCGQELYIYPGQNLQRDFKEEYYLRIRYMKPCRTDLNTPNRTRIIRTLTATHVVQNLIKSLYIYIFFF